MSATDVQALLRTSSCYGCYGASVEDMLELGLLATIVSGGGGQAPAAPSNLDISDASLTNNIILTWTNNGTATTNEIHRSSDGITFALLATVAGAATTFSDVSGIPAATQWYYKVRACTGATCSAFTAVRSAGRTLGNAVSANFTFPSLVIHFGDFDLTNNNATTTVNCALLRIIHGTFTVRNTTLLVSINFPSLTLIEGNFNTSFSTVQTISMPALVSVLTSSMDISHNPNLTSINLDSLTTVDNYISVDDCPMVTTISLPVLTSVPNLFLGGFNTGLTTVSIPILDTLIGIVSFAGATSLTNLNMNNLQAVGGDLNFQTAGLVTLTLPSLNSVGGTFQADSCPNLTTITLTNFVSLTVDWNTNSNPVMTTVNIPNLIFADGIIIDSSACALNTATVNLFLSRGVASGTTISVYQLDGGTNANESGAGVADKATLCGLGNTVSTNNLGTNC